MLRDENATSGHLITSPQAGNFRRRDESCLRHRWAGVVGKRSYAVGRAIHCGRLISQEQVDNKDCETTFGDNNNNMCLAKFYQVACE